MKAIEVAHTGGPDALELVDMPAPAPRDSEVLVDVVAAGVNFRDIYVRQGLYPAEVPYVPGKEGTGKIAEDPSGTFPAGTVVAWMDGCRPGAYAQQTCVARDRLVAVPDRIDPIAAGALLLRGMTAHFLTHAILPPHGLSEGDTCLLTAGAGGVGRLVTQFATSMGARVFSVVSTEEKEAIARSDGAVEVFRYGDDLAAKVREVTSGMGVDLVLDGVGKTTFDQSLRSARRRGTVCLFGASSGPVAPMDPQELNKHGSLFLTRPKLSDFVADVEDFRMRAQAVTQAVFEGNIELNIGAVYPLADARRAHADLAARRTTGAVVLQVS